MLMYPDRHKRVTQTSNHRLAIIFTMALSIMLALPSATILASDITPAATASPSEGSLDYDRAVELALRQSPYLIDSSLEIDIRHLDVKDSQFSFVPAMTLRSTYYFATPNRSGNDYSIVFNIGPYNPVMSYFSLQVSRMVEEMAMLAHEKVISEGLYKLAQGYLELDSLIRLEAVYREMEGLAEQDLAYVSKRGEAGAASPLETQIAQQQLAVAQAETERIQASQETVASRITRFLGMTNGSRQDLMVEQAQSQVIGDFDPSQASLNQARERSFDLRIQKIKEKLQAKNVTLAYSKFIPNFSMGVRNIDPLSDVEGENDYYASVSMEIPIWTGMKRVDNVSRQKMVLKQMEAETDDKKYELKSDWQEAVTEMKQASLSLQLAKSSLELAELKEKQAEISYKSNTQPLTALLDDRRARLNAEKGLILTTKEYDLAVLRLRHLSGDLFNGHVNVQGWRNDDAAPYCGIHVVLQPFIILSSSSPG